MLKRTFLLVAAILLLLTSTGYAGLLKDSVDISEVNNKRTIGEGIPIFISEISNGNTKNDFTNLSMSSMPISFPGIGRKSWGPGPDNPGYTHFIERPMPISFPGIGRKFWGPGPDNPGYTHFIERPNVGNPPFVAVAPEPISYVLFITGGMLLAGLRYLKREKNSVK